MENKVAATFTALVLSANLSYSQTQKTVDMKPFTISINEHVLTDLQNRLANTRWPDEPADAGWNFGTNQQYLKELVDYWQTTYDWRKQEALLNAYPQYTVTIDGVTIHFVYVKGKGKNPKPLLLTHGWPDSFLRYYKAIPFLTDPAGHGADADQSFDVIIPSLPGFGFSDRTTKTTAEVADLWVKLMTETLGYTTFFAAGGDIGGDVTMALANRFPQLVEGIHLTDMYMSADESMGDLTAAEQQYQHDLQTWFYTNGAYAMMQSTKPQTVAYALNDSPVGLASWMISFVESGAENYQIDDAFGTKDDLLTNIMIYWVTQTAGSAARMYALDAQAAYLNPQERKDKSRVPAGIAMFPREAQFPRSWAERFFDVKRFTIMEHGGHFAALEVPDVWSNELRDFFYNITN